MKQLRGGCLCGAVEYSIPDALQYAGYCHCSDCRRFSGSLFSAFGGIAAENFEIVRGANSITRYPKTESTVLGFCAKCGSSLYADKPKTGMVNVRLGTLLDLPSLKPQAHAFVGSKIPWYEICDGLPQFEAAPVHRPNAT